MVRSTNRTKTGNARGRPTKNLDILGVAHALGLEGPSRQSNGRSYFQCPHFKRHNHGDAHPSLEINESKNRAFCNPCGFGGDAIGLVKFTLDVGYNQAIQWLKKKGLHCGGGERQGLSNGNAAKPVERAPTAGSVNTAQYDYQDEAGNVVFQTVRLDPKNFFQRRRGPNGKWINDLKGVRRVPYHLPRLIEAVARGDRVFVVEGEKDVHTLVDLGLVATTNAGGARHWLPEFSTHLKGADVVILPDNDLIGEEHGQKVLESLKGIARTVRVLHLPDLEEKGDVSDWIAAGGTRERLEDLVGAAKPAYESPKIHWRSLDEFLSIQYPPVQSVWYDNLIVTGQIHCLGASMGVGKTCFLTQFGLSVAGGLEFLGKQTATGKVMLLQTELPDQYQQIRTREMLDWMLQDLDSETAAGARAVVAENFFCRDTARIFRLWAEGDDKRFRLHQAEIVEMVEELKPTILLLDPFAKVFSNPPPNLMRVALEFAEELVETHNLSVLIVAHWSKSARSAKEPDTEIAISGGTGLLRQL
jgi:hypothetical protein